MQRKSNEDLAEAEGWSALNILPREHQFAQ